MYLFARYRFNWNEIQFSFWSTYAMLTNLIGKDNFYMSLCLINELASIDLNGGPAFLRYPQLAYFGREAKALPLKGIPFPPVGHFKNAF